MVFWKCTLRSTQTQASVWDLIHICTESVFHMSLPYNYSAKCFRGRQGRRSGWSPDFLTPSSTSTGDLWFTVISIPPHQTTRMSVRSSRNVSLSDPPINYWIITRSSVSFFIIHLLILSPFVQVNCPPFREGVRVDLWPYKEFDFDTPQSSKRLNKLCT